MIVPKYTLASYIVCFSSLLSENAHNNVSGFTQAPQTRSFVPSLPSRNTRLMNTAESWEPEWIRNTQHQNNDQFGSSKPEWGDTSSKPEWSDTHNTHLESPTEDILKPIRESDERRHRLNHERSLKEKYARGDELLELRSNLQDLSKELRQARKSSDGGTVEETIQKMRELRSQDPEHVYGEALKASEEAILDGRPDEAEDFRQVADDAKICIPHFNLEGLWVGKYGKHGYEMINITYTGNSLIAYKVTGDKNVPKGEVTFTADLAPNRGSSMDPIDLSEAASKKFGVEQIVRFPGEGQVASKGYVKKEWIEGQLLMIGNYFSFAWVPIGHQIFFGRPSPELVLKLLKESQLEDLEGRDKGMLRMREHATKSLEETLILEEDDEINTDFFYSSEVGFDECDLDDLENCFQ